MAGNPLFGKRIRELREAKLRDDAKFTLRQFATAVGISPTLIFEGHFSTAKAAGPARKKASINAIMMVADFFVNIVSS